MYVERLIGLISFGFAQICGPSGLHGHFLDRDIESLTVFVNRSDNMNPSAEVAEDLRSWSVMYMAMMHDILHAHAYLHEEFHHSMFFGMLMSNKDFVGITEYGFSLFFILLSLSY